MGLTTMAAQQKVYAVQPQQVVYQTGAPQQGQPTYYVPQNVTGQTQQPPTNGEVYVANQGNGYPVSGQQQPQVVYAQQHARPRNACIKCGHFNDLAPTCCIVL